MKRYFFITAGLTLGFCLIVALFNYRVDPYAIYHYKHLNPDRMSRIDQIHHLRITKPWHIVQTKPTAIVLGTSRSASVRPQHPAWPQTSYNLSVPGLTSYEMLRFIEHTQANGPLSKLMIGLDFEGFIRSEPQFQLGFEESRMARDADDLAAPRFIWQLVSDMRSTLFSLSGTTQSVKALTGNADIRRRYFSDGTWENKESKLTGSRGYAYVGKKSVFNQRNEKLSLDTNLDNFADILRFAHRQKIETRLFITPEHVFIIDLWSRLGYSELWKEFHRRVIEVNHVVAIEMGVEPFPVFGFNHLREVVDEPVNSAQDSGRSWFTDGVHFRAELGKKIMDAVWTDGDGFGIKLDIDSIESYLSLVDQLRHGFESDNTTLTTDLRRAISPELQ